MNCKPPTWFGKYWFTQVDQFSPLKLHCLAPNSTCQVILLCLLQFIQPDSLQPKEVVCLTIPGSAMLHQYDLGNYLRQNMLNFLFTPKNADSKSDRVAFRDYTQPGSPNIPDEYVFLHNRSQHHYGKSTYLFLNASVLNSYRELLIVLVLVGAQYWFPCCLFIFFCMLRDA